MESRRDLGGLLVMMGDKNVDTKLQSCGNIKSWEHEMFVKDAKNDQ